VCGPVPNAHCQRSSLPGAVMAPPLPGKRCGALAAPIAPGSVSDTDSAANSARGSCLGTRCLVLQKVRPLSSTFNHLLFHGERGSIPFCSGLGCDAPVTGRHPFSNEASESSGLPVLPGACLRVQLRAFGAGAQPDAFVLGAAVAAKQDATCLAAGLCARGLSVPAFWIRPQFPAVTGGTA
jgi:hypothetical protein